MNDESMLMLSVLRHKQMRLYMLTCRYLAKSREEFDSMRDQVRQYSEHTSRPDQYKELVAVVETPAFEGFIAMLAEIDEGHAASVERLLKTTAYEIHLSALKQESLEHYLDTLRVITEDEIISSIRAGTILNSMSANGAPEIIKSDEAISGAFLEEPTATARLHASTLARVLHRFSATGDLSGSNAQGLRLKQVVILGELNLNWLDLPFPLGFLGCDFHSWVSADHLKVPWLQFESCDFTPHQISHFYNFGAFNATGLQVATSLRFLRCAGLGQLFLLDAHIGEFVLENPNQSSDILDDDFETADETQEITLTRTVVSGANFGRLYFPREGDPIDFSIDEGSTIRVGEVQGQDPEELVTEVRDWLIQGNYHAAIWEEFAVALGSNNLAEGSAQASDLRLEYRRHVNKSKNFISRFFTWLFVDLTVGYFHKPFRAVYWLLAIFMVTWGITFAFHGELVQSPLANSTVPTSWLEEWGTAAAWSFMYSLDSTFSPLSLGQIETMWPVSVWVGVILAFLKALSLILLGLFISAVTTLTSKRIN